LKLLKNIKSNSYLFNVITLMSGTALSQGILIAATPILTRLFTPENFGILALYLAIVGTISVVSSWKYELAIMLPEDEEDAKALVFLSIIITFFTSLIVFVILFFLKGYLGAITENVKLFIWLVPVGILINGLLQIFVTWGTRNEQYKSVANTRVAQSSVTVFSQLSFGIISISSLSLIYGNIIGIFSSLIYLVYQTSKKHYMQLTNISKKRIIENLSKYKNFPKFQSTSVLINSLSQHLPIILLTMFYSAEIAGFYALTHRALTAPARLIGNSVRQVYFQRASKIFNKNESIRQILSKSTLGLIKVSIIPFIIIGIFAQSIFIFVFGKEWLVSGIYAQLIIIYIFALTINPPSVMTLQILGMQKFSMVYEIFLAIFRFLAIYLGYLFYNNHFVSISMFSIVGVAFNIYLITYVFKKVRLIEQMT